MRSKTVDRLLKSTPKDVEIFVDLYADLVVRINQILKAKELTKKDLAEKLGKQPSEISKWLNGEHNFTLRSLAKLSAELGETLLEVPKKKENSGFIVLFEHRHEIKTTVKKVKSDMRPGSSWQPKVNYEQNESIHVRTR